MPSVKDILFSGLGMGMGALAYHGSQAPILDTDTVASIPYAAVESFYHASAPSCPIDGPLSCHNSTAVKDSCCFIYPGGQLLLTQFWDTRPSIGPNVSWTLHGLWPDLCDGRYESFCTSAPRYPNITAILIKHNQTNLLQTMLEYWLPNRGTAENFWMHEWNKHGTCINTLSPKCYTSSSDSEETREYETGQEVVDYFARAVRLFKQLDTFQALADAGIHPSNTRRYTNREISDALVSVSGAPVVLGCRRGALNQAWYTFNVRGNLQSGAFVASEPAGSGKGTCPEKGIRWFPKDNWGALLSG